MEISPELGVLIMMNNYFHDVATALLAAGAFTLWALYRSLGEAPKQAAVEFYLKAYRRGVLLVKIALVWIVLGGIPRTIFYTRFEWANAAGKGQVPALVVKHILMFTLVALGVYGWITLKRKAAQLHNDSTPTLH